MSEGSGLAARAVEREPAGDDRHRGDPVRKAASEREHVVPAERPAGGRGTRHVEGVEERLSVAEQFHGPPTISAIFASASDAERRPATLSPRAPATRESRRKKASLSLVNRCSVAACASSAT